METIVDWLVKIERLANEFYSDASKYFSDDKQLRTLLQHLSSDEADHYHIMTSASQYLGAHLPKKPQIEVDDSIKLKIEATFNNVTSLLKSGHLTSELVIDCIVESEYSEWNYLFLYVLNSLKTEDRIFEHSEIQVQRHMRYIENYLGSTVYGKNKLQYFTKLSYAKKEKILIVDDEIAISELLSSLLEDICDSDRAINGKEALEMIKNNPYGLVISDVGMPVMDGLELYKNSIPLFINPNEVFIFHSGKLDKDMCDFFTTNDITFLEKPSSIMNIRNLVNSKLQLS
ncbi:MAG: response regulator [Desulfuromonadaceae bacterium]|nr:response regulator [Desulfuromonadaceae bacterium]